MRDTTPTQILGCMSQTAFEDILNVQRDILEVATQLSEQINQPTSYIFDDEFRSVMYAPLKRIIFNVNDKGKITRLYFQ